MSYTTARHRSNLQIMDEIRRNVAEYELFITGKLRPQLASAEKSAHQIECEIEEYAMLRKQLEQWCPKETAVALTIDRESDDDHVGNQLLHVIDAGSGMVRVDLGYRKVWSRARISDTDGSTDLSHPKQSKCLVNTIFVHVGMGFHIEMLLPEAIEYIRKRISFLSEYRLQPRRVEVQRVQKHIQDCETLLDTLSRED
jgi:hypothetical protein